MSEYRERTTGEVKSQGEHAQGVLRDRYRRRRHAHAFTGVARGAHAVPGRDPGLSVEISNGDGVAVRKAVFRRRD